MRFSPFSLALSLSLLLAPAVAQADEFDPCDAPDWTPDDSGGMWCGPCPWDDFCPATGRAWLADADMCDAEGLLPPEACGNPICSAVYGLCNAPCNAPETWDPITCGDVSYCAAAPWDSRCN